MKKQTTPLLITLLGLIVLLFCVTNDFNFYGFISIPFIIIGMFWYDHNEKANEWQYLKLIKRYNSLKDDFNNLECVTRSTVGQCSSRIDEIDKYKKQNIKGQIIYKKGSADKK